MSKDVSKSNIEIVDLKNTEFLEAGRSKKFHFEIVEVGLNPKHKKPKKTKKD